MQSVSNEKQTDNVSAKTATISITVSDTIITAKFSDSETTRAFLETLPRTFTMNRYGDREYYGRMESISENGQVIADFENGDVTYNPAGPSFEIFFAGEDRSSQGGLIHIYLYYKHQGWLSGRVTTDDHFTFYEKPELCEDAAPVPEGDFIAKQANIY